MGHQFSSSIRETNKLFQMPLTQYSLKDRINSALSIWKNKSIPFDELLEYRTVVNCEGELSKIYEIFRMRHNHLLLPATRYLTCQQQGIKGCGQYYKGHIYLDSSLATLSIINDIPFYDSLHIYAVAFRGFQILFKKFGYFDVFEDMFHIFDNGRLKVWCNSQLYKFAPQPYLLDPNGREQDMLYRVINIIDENVDKSQHQNLKQMLYNKIPAHSHLKSFDQANIILRQICKQNNLQAPQRLKCISQLTRQDIQRLLIQQQAVQIQSRQNLKQLHNMATMNTLNIVQPEFNGGRGEGRGEGNTSFRVQEDWGGGGDNRVNGKSFINANNGISLMSINQVQSMPSPTTRQALKNISMPNIVRTKSELLQIPTQGSSGVVHPIQEVRKFSEQKSLSKNKRIVYSTQKINPVYSPKSNHLANRVVVNSPSIKTQKNIIQPLYPVNNPLKIPRVSIIHNIQPRNLPPRPIPPSPIPQSHVPPVPYASHSPHVTYHTPQVHNVQPTRIVQGSQNPTVPSRPKPEIKAQMQTSIEYVQSERYKFSSPQKRNQSFQCSQDRLSSFENLGSGHYQKAIKSVVIPDLVIAEEKPQEIVNFLNSHETKPENGRYSNSFRYRQATTQKFNQSGQFQTQKSPTNFEQRFQQSQQTKKSLPFEYQKTIQRQLYSEPLKSNKETNSMESQNYPRNHRLKSSGTEYTDPKFMQMLSSKDYSNITINPTFNLTVSSESLGNGQKNIPLISTKNDELFFSFSTATNKERKYRSHVGNHQEKQEKQSNQSYGQKQKEKDKDKDKERLKYKGGLEMGQIRNYLDKMKVKYGDFDAEDHVLEKIHNSHKQSGQFVKNSCGESQNANNSGAESGSFAKKYEASIDREIWSDLVELRKNRNQQ